MPSKLSNSKCFPFLIISGRCQFCIFINTQSFSSAHEGSLAQSERCKLVILFFTLFKIAQSEGKSIFNQQFRNLFSPDNYFDFITAEKYFADQNVTLLHNLHAFSLKELCTLAEGQVLLRNCHNWGWNILITYS